ncbi:MAG: peptide deformylase [bacterium]|nr:peptide deformylase [bacterium]
MLPVIRLGNPILRTLSEDVPQSLLGSGELFSMADNLIHTMFKEEGVGLAAPQVAESLRFFAYWVPGDEDHPGIDPTVLVNPEIRPVGDTTEEGWEGCLSIPGLRGSVPRFSRIKVKTRTVEGASISFTADGFHARVIQHELDHLDGIVFLDRMTSMRSLAFEEELMRLVSESEDEAE